MAGESGDDIAFGIAEVVGDALTVGEACGGLIEFVNSV